MKEEGIPPLMLFPLDTAVDSAALRKQPSVSATTRVLVSGQKAESCARDEQPYGGGCPPCETSRHRHGGDRLPNPPLMKPVVTVIAVKGFPTPPINNCKVNSICVA